MTTATLAAHRKAGPGPRLGWLLPAGFALLAGLDAGLVLLGLPAPVNSGRLAEVHGVLLVLGFVGTVIALERATALDRWYGYAAPLLLGAGGVLLVLAPVPLTLAKVVVASGMAAFTLLYVPLWRRQHDHVQLTELLATAFGLAGAILWIGRVEMLHVLPWLIGFVVFTIAAERVELARITMGAGAGVRLLAHAVAFGLALLIGTGLPDLGAVLTGLVLCSLVAWLVIHDVARRTIRLTGVTRYAAACILAGYVWLSLAALLLLLGAPTRQPVYDAIVHSVFLGYTISMILAHAPTILPAVLHVRMKYRPVFWVPAITLQLALIVRIWFGDGLGHPLAWQIGGAGGVLAILLFLLVAVGSSLPGRSRSRTGAAAATDRRTESSVS
ncbi:hypothetical protein [Granulicoccus phenolivorans]|uniref:hypothetical protein n=1 Tax=Granulicoccus phenolivorans TaxID=266854 RepID=UPI000B0DB445|nr:hypothetical protein [Granulicoccus phenolivorans]